MTLATERHDVRRITGLDATSAVGFLETDKVENVGFYKKFGFDVVREAQVIGTVTYFTRRAAQVATVTA